MAEEVRLPSMGEGITEATLVKWLKKPGDKIEKDDPLVEVSTDKVDTEIPSPASGYLVKTWADEGDVIAVNAVIAHIAASPDAKVEPPKPGASAPKREVASAAAPAAASAAKTVPAATSGIVRPAARPMPTGPVHHGKVRSSPLVRRMAAEHDVDLRYVPGTGLNGRITRRDLEAYLAAPQAAFAAPVEKLPAHLEYGRLTTVKDGDKETLEGVPVRREKMSRMRALIAEHMVRSVRTSPHVTMVFEIDLDQIVRTREACKDRFEKTHGFKITYTPFFIHAAVQAIKEHPIVNVSVDGEDILWKDDINVGCAVALESGLIVPVIKRAQNMNLLETARALDDLVKRARSKQLSPEDVQGGTFSITNPGMFGSYVATPIINQPQVAILCINSIVKKPVVFADEIMIRPMIQIGLTFDHRVIDGEGGARYLATLKGILESGKGLGEADLF